MFLACWVLRWNVREWEVFSSSSSSEGKICFVGTDSQVRQHCTKSEVQEQLDASGCCLLPGTHLHGQPFLFRKCVYFFGETFVTFWLRELSGFVDGHTHAVWTGDRVGEFAMKVREAHEERERERKKRITRREEAKANVCSNVNFSFALHEWWQTYLVCGGVKLAEALGWKTSPLATAFRVYHIKDQLLVPSNIYSVRITCT